MNVGTARLDTVNFSQPQLVHSPSQRSLAASDHPSDHSSFSDYASEASSIEQRNRSVQYETPPSRAHSPIATKTADSEMTLPSRPVAAYPAPLNVRRSQAPETRIRISDLYRDIHNISPPTPGVDETPYIRFAIEQLTRDEELMGRARQGSDSSLDYPGERVISDEGLGYNAVLTPQKPAARRTRRPRTPIEDVTRQVVDDIFVTADPPEHSQFPQLGYLPPVLRLPVLLLFICVCLLMIAALTFCNVYCLQNSGLYDYDGTGTARYFVFQFMPQLLGIIVIFWIFVLQAAVYRIIPFASMATRRSQDRVLQDMSIHSANFLLPDLRHFRCGEPVIGICLAVFWISYIAVPLLSCMFQTELFEINGLQRWRWTSVQAVVWILVALYALLLAATVLIALRFRRRESALMWDPVSLADLIMLFQKSNIVPDLDGSEISESIRAHIPPRPLRLGYWTTSRTAEIFHTIGEENAPLRRLSRGQNVSNGKHMEGRDSPNLNIEQQRYSHAESFNRNIHSPYFRYRWSPRFLRDSAVVAWIVAALTLYLAFLIVSFVNSAVKRGFPPGGVRTVTNPHGFSPSNFLFSFLPCLLGMLLLLAWQPIDTYFRAIQPFANLSSSPDGASAQHSLLLSYPACYPLQTTFVAIQNHDYKVAWISLVSVLSATIPVLAGGIFTAQFFNQSQVRIAATMPAYYVLCVSLGVYAFSFLVVWPKRKRYLPHAVSTLADYLSFLYVSPLLADPVFVGVRSKDELSERLLGQAGAGKNKRRRIEVRGEAGEERFVFGIYVGRDGREHLGIDRLHRAEIEPRTREARRGGRI
ncbi:hypothetical protein GJ744_010231 [Endocarpon pusillum]|uniref:Phosphoribosylaminoimidazole-succinocarboxamide synthase n=1 Tax=Endocarpon pusillum TaxID=364733 RepID=A0A8H7AEL0_9EURO|nr:hypothetical protein GJ744_010231 [Endocarpon pusillum]